MNTKTALFQDGSALERSKPCLFLWPARCQTAKEINDCASSLWGRIYLAVMGRTVTYALLHQDKSDFADIWNLCSYEWDSFYCNLEHSFFFKIWISKKMLCWVQIKLKLLFFPPFLYFYFSLKKIFFCFSVSESPESHSTYLISLTLKY